jgi:hypothetical protein
MDQMKEKLLQQIKHDMLRQTDIMIENITKILSTAIEEINIMNNNELKEEISRLKFRVQHLEREIKKNNVILHGISETEKSNSELLELVLETLNTVSNRVDMEQWKNWEIERVHRLGKKKANKKRPILVTLKFYWRKLALLRNYERFPDHIHVTEDFPRDVLTKRKELKERLIDDRKNGKITYFQYEKLVVKNTLFYGNKEY